VSIADVKQIPIADIAARLGITLDAHGKALCFKGHDKSPSLSVNVRGNYFKCFGCNIRGSGIDLVKEYLNITTGEAIKWIESQYHLEEKTGFKCKESPGGYKDTTPANKTPYRGLKRVSGHPTSRGGKEYSDIYRHFLDLLSTEEAVKYLEGRGIRRDITEQAGIKCIPQDMNGIKKTLNDKHGIERLKDAGLVADSKDGKPYFVFTYHRLIIPYYDREGNIINLQGRNIDIDREPKYRLLSGITVPLYNVQSLKDTAPGGTVYLCEGAIDALSCYQLGLEHPVGIAGVNNFKDEYFKTLEPYKIIIAGDKDTAGKDFYLRIKKGYLNRGKEIHALDYERLKEDYNITGEAKDLNDIARQADYKHFNGIQPRRIYSHLVNESYTERDGGIQFDSGIFYTWAEVEKLDGITPDALKQIHTIKKTFKGILI
jgi:DNA primase